MSGWIKLHREIFESDIWHDVTTFRLFIYLIGKASHQDGLKYKGMTLNKGQFVRSYRKLAEDLTYKEGRGYKNYSLSTIRACVKKLVENDRITVEETELGTIFTIVNYKKFQEDELHFNALNPPESPNVNRTEHRTDEKGIQYSDTNGLVERGFKRLNTLKEEVRTNAELMPNEVRTNAEQDQELKNLRIKELNNTTTTVDENLSEVVQTFEANICPLSPLQYESLEKWLFDFNNNKDIIFEAIKIADDRNRRNFGFVEFLLKEWANNNLSSVEQVRTFERNKFQRKPANVSRFPNRREAELPNYMTEEKPQAPVDDDFEQKKRELEARLKKYEDCQEGVVLGE